MTITEKNLDKAPKTLYMVRINVGGLVHHKIYKLNYKGEGQWWDKTGDFDTGIALKNEFSFYKNKSIKLGKILDHGGCSDFITDKLEDAEIFLIGALSIIKFMKKCWFDNYEFHGQKNEG